MLHATWCWGSSEMDVLEANHKDRSMPSLVHVHSESWEFPVWLTLPIVFAALVYLRGWLSLRSTSSNVIPAWRAGSFLLGTFSIWVAVASPIATSDHELLTAHMVQHLLLMSLAPPLIWLSAPLLSFAHGLPRQFVNGVMDSLFRSPFAQRVGRALGDLTFCWLAATATLVVWHVPAALALGMQSGPWHAVQHASFLATGLLFWWPVVRPWPSVPAGPQWSIVLYLFLATLPCDILSGFLVFSERITYPVYLSTSRHPGLVLEDQQSAGALMWTCVTIVYLVAGTILSTRLLSPDSYREGERLRSASPARPVLKERPQGVETT
jgi:putative membrane protein